MRAAIAVSSVAVSALALAPASDAAPAETCLKAPQGAAPQGSHWYYRLERPALRKCWYLAAKARKVTQRAAAQKAPQQEPDEESDAPPAPVANAAAPAAIAAPPVANAAPAPAAEPTPVITTLVTRNVSNTDETVSPAAPNAAQPLVAPEAPPLPLVQAPSEPQAPSVAAEQPASPADQAASVSADGMSTLQLLLGALALLGLVASAAFFVTAALRRRDDVLNAGREADALPFEPSPEMADDDRPAVQPMPALDPIRQRGDDVDEVLQRLARRRRVA